MNLPPRSLAVAASSLLRSSNPLPALHAAIHPTAPSSTASMTTTAVTTSFTPQRPSLLVVDFDDTCTTSDTTSTIIATAISDASTTAGIPPSPLQRLHQHLVTTYAQQQHALLEQLLPAADDGGQNGHDPSTALVYDEDWLSGFNHRLSTFHKRMNDVVIDSHILRFALQESLATAASTQVSLHPNCASVLQRALASGIPTHVCSVSWSSTLIAATLAHHLPSATVRSEVGDDADNTVAVLCGALGCIPIHANELEMNKEGVATGDLVRRVEAGPDKLAVFESLLLEKLPEGPSVYIGDSPTDILPLLAADVGIVFGKNPTLARVLRAAGVRLCSLADCVQQPGGGVQKETHNECPVLFFADNWNDIAKALCLLDE